MFGIGVGIRVWIIVQIILVIQKLKSFFSIFLCLVVVQVYLESHRMESTVGLGDSSIFQLVFFPCSLPIAVPIFLRIFCLYVQGGLCTDGAFWCPSTHFFCWFVIWGTLFCTIVWGIAASFGGVFTSVFSIWRKVGLGASFTFGGIGHDALATNKLAKAGIVFGHGVSSLVSGAVNLAVVVAMGCCAIGGLPQLGVNGLYSSWHFLVGLGISWTLFWDILYTVNGIGHGLSAVVVGFTTDVCVEVAIVATASGSGLISIDLSSSLTLNCFFMAVSVLFFLSAALLGTGVFLSEVVLPSYFCAVGYHLCILTPSRSASSLLEMGRDRVWDSMVCTICPGWCGLS